MVAITSRGFVSLNRIKSSRNTLTEHTVKIVLRRWQARMCAEAGILVLTGSNALQRLEQVDAQKQESQCLLASIAIQRLVLTVLGHSSGKAGHRAQDTWTERHESAPSLHQVEYS